MSTHTPGPWQTDGSRVYHQANPGGRKTYVAETLGDPSIAARQANARLIAAAPELLDLLRLGLTVNASDWDSPHPDEWARRVRELVARVEGAA